MKAGNVGMRIVFLLVAVVAIFTSGCSNVDVEKSYPLHLYDGVELVREDYSNDRGGMLASEVVLKMVSKDCVVADGFDEADNVMVAFPKGSEIVDGGSAVRVPYSDGSVSDGYESYRKIEFSKGDMGLGVVVSVDEAEKYGVVMNKNCWQLDEPVYLLVP